MTRTGPQRIPGAVLDLFFGNDRYSGSDMEVNCGVIHTTEGSTLYDYNQGSSAPTVTSVPDFKNKRLVHHQHFDIDESARALVNKAGGVLTNTANVFQWELVGTCDPARHADWTRRGVPHIYWPEPPDWAVRDMAWLMRWLLTNHGVPLVGVPEWRAYPASYGNTSVRMTFSQWTNFRGWCGHQHVPENDHGDPGNLPFARILAAAKGGTPPEEDDVALTDAEIKRIVDKVWAQRITSPTADPKKGDPTRSASTFLAYQDKFHHELMARFDAVEKQINDRIEAQLKALIEALQEDK
ncbi:N-acetylmuramoyl-L-alanine amidase [Streptomyces candidus]|uniref:Uncharacterized protein n=1 Tax=Streptomyces candidus TaxID=67283 RepID=A0A7X0HLH9_9ACTN|nr:N-acetylmuramoyl-L-alanine amidase [Streptomyces candidus]MBB6439907.1 hypothetical protein [Streptomyces candidus]GHH57877.1 hypothetical protein GCM10018773_65820 [Streptomyces candidus]